ncbi:conserved protein of unknown function [uncultured Woeseiaceae bacterium]|uniref:Uncharacterized protein n=1 Tax=uncultured Woeseiaceae bacterium TaxID=1983305 RepID=A0A7D9H808_9GAMM|nr:conserved protein of unknown function [uncultured Woeseiaceae bacterium]
MTDDDKIKKDELQLSSLRLPQDFRDASEVKKLHNRILVRKPDRQWFIRTHPKSDFWIEAAILVLKELNETYIVDPAVYNELPGDVVPMKLVPSITRQGNPFLWPIRLPDYFGHLDEWNRSALAAAEIAQRTWIRVASNREVGAYDTIEVVAQISDPDWPDLGLEEWLRLSFPDRHIRDADHPAIRKLRGEL